MNNPSHLCFQVIRQGSVTHTHTHTHTYG